MALFSHPPALMIEKKPMSSLIPSSYCVVQKLVPTKLCKAGTPYESGKEVHFQDLSNVRKLEIVDLMEESACFKDNSEKDIRSTCF